MLFFSQLSILRLDCQTQRKGNIVVYAEVGFSPGLARARI